MLLTYKTNNGKIKAKRHFNRECNTENSKEKHLEKLFSAEFIIIIILFFIWNENMAILSVHTYFIIKFISLEEENELQSRFAETRTLIFFPVCCKEANYWCNRPSQHSCP
jgi:hypothetical protein